MADIKALRLQQKVHATHGPSGLSLTAETMTELVVQLFRPQLLENAAANM